MDGASVYPLEVVKEALNRYAAAVIRAHNTPRAQPNPLGPISTSRTESVKHWH